jgi:two-component system, OmpR family, response regulator
VRVLVVEDEARLAAGLQAGLETAGYAVDVGRDGVDGLWLARENAYDAIVLDLMLPNLDGYQVCATLRREQIWAPVLILTAKEGDTDQVEGLDTGADDYLTKPFSYQVLLARLRALVRRGQTPRPAVLQAGQLRLDPASRRVWCGPVLVTLTARDVALLEFLMRRPGQVVSKAEILAHVWDFEYQGDPNIVEVYISRLRARLERPFGRASILTIRGAGYLLNDDPELAEPPGRPGPPAGSRIP